MKNGILLSLFFVLATTSLLTGCFDEKFTDNPSHLLSFSTGIVKFDTIFTDKGSATLSFRVYNRNKRALRIESIRLADAEKSGFYINVDGEKGPEIGGIELSAQDSLYVFVEANINPNDTSKPFLIKDSIVFLTNGIYQDVKLEAYGQNATVFRGGKNINNDTTFTADKPFLIYDSLVVAPEATLTLAEGTTLYLHDKAFLRIEGRLLAQGSNEHRVTFRGDRTDRVFDNLPYDYYAGQWGGIHFGSESYENEWNFVDMHGSSWGIRIDSSDVTRSKLTLQHSIIHNAATDLIAASYARINGYNSQITNAGGALLRLHACPSEWIHCTFANLYNWDIITSAAFTLSGYEYTDTTDLTMHPYLNIANSIVVSRNSLLTPADISNLSAIFERCLFSVNGNDDDNFINCLWGQDPAFAAIGDEYIFDFHLTESSPARTAGDIKYINDTTAIDLYGIPRLTDGTLPDLGASNYTIPKNEEE